MDLVKSGAFSRREFLRRSALASGYGLANFLDQGQPSSLAIIADAADPVASAPAAVWAIRELEKALSHRGLTVQRALSMEASSRGDFCILASGGSSPIDLTRE